jgi:hypothetical protein
MSFTQNRFGALLGEEETEIDKLGNIKPVEKKGDAQPPTRREQRRATTGTRQPAGKFLFFFLPQTFLHEIASQFLIKCLLI